MWQRIGGLTGKVSQNHDSESFIMTFCDYAEAGVI